jgi:tetratricopeptide (TPR) repeat protein
MKKLMMAVSVSIFLVLGFSLPVSSHTPDDAFRRSLVNSAAPDSVQTPSQVSAATSDPGHPQLTPEEMGDLLMARKQYPEAVEAYRQLTAQNPGNAVYWNKLGIALHQQAALTAALKSYERALKANPQYADAENNIGTIWYQRKKYSKSIRAYKKAIKITDDMPVLYSNLGYAYFADKKYEDSIAAFRTALAKDPQFFERNSSRTGSVLQDRSVTDRGRFYFMLAKSFAESGNYERCILYLRKAKEEGYATFAADLKKDQDFAAVMKDPGVLDLLAPKPDYVAEP